MGLTDLVIVRRAQIRHHRPAGEREMLARATMFFTARTRGPITLSIPPTFASMRHFGEDYRPLSMYSV